MAGGWANDLGDWAPPTLALPWLRHYFHLSKAVKSEKMIHREIVAREIIYRIICRNIFLSIKMIMKTRLKAIEV